MFCFQRNDLKIVWKELNFSGNPPTFHGGSVLSTSDYVFKTGFRPSMSFRTSEKGAQIWRQTFVSQKLVNHFENVFEREYISLIFKEGIHNIMNDTPDEPHDWTVTDISKGNDLILGSVGFLPLSVFPDNQLIVFLVNDSLQFCSKNTARKNVLDLDKAVKVFLLINEIMKIIPTFQCVSNRSVLLDCSGWPTIAPTIEPPNYWAIIIVVVVILVWIAILGCFIIWKYGWKGVKEYLWPPKTEKKRNSTDKTLTTVNSSSTDIKTVNSITGKTIGSEENLNKSKNKF